MQQKGKTKHRKFDTGYKFPTARHKLSSSTVATYLKAVEENSKLYQGTELVPPTAVAALTFAAFSQGVSFPQGAIHAFQRIEFKDIVSTQDTIVCQARVSRSQKRGQMHLLTIELQVFNQNNKEVLTGELGVILPEQDQDKES